MNSDEALANFLQRAGHEGLVSYLDPRGETLTSAFDRRMKWAVQHRRDPEHGGEAAFLLEHVLELRTRVQNAQDCAIDDQETTARFGAWYPGAEGVDLELPVPPAPLPEPELTEHGDEEVDPASITAFSEALDEVPDAPEPMGAQVPDALLRDDDTPVVHPQGTVPPVRRRARRTASHAPARERSFTPPPEPRLTPPRPKRRRRWPLLVGAVGLAGIAIVAWWAGEPMTGPDPESVVVMEPGAPGTPSPTPEVPPAPKAPAPPRPRPVATPAPAPRPASEAEPAPEAALAPEADPDWPPVRAPGAYVGLWTGSYDDKDFTLDIEQHDDTEMIAMIGFYDGEEWVRTRVQGPFDAKSRSLELAGEDVQLEGRLPKVEGRATGTLRVGNISRVWVAER